MGRLKGQCKQYYILYKVIRDDLEQVKDIEYLIEFTNQRELTQHLRCDFRTITKMLNKEYSKDLRTYKEYCIIKEIVEK